MLFISLFCLVTIFVTGQAIGTKVKMKATDGKEYTGVIKGIEGDKFRVKYDGTDFESLLLNTQFTVVTSNSGANTGTQNTGTQNTGYKVGDKITAKDRRLYNNWLPAEIMEIGNGKYKVHYTGWSDIWDDWIPNDWIKPLNAKTPATNNSNTEKALDPEMNGAIPKIVGTAWYCLTIYNKGTTPKNNHVHFPYIFFKDGNYEVQSGGYFTKGKYRVSGNKITQISDGTDNLTETYTITWNAKEKYMELTSTSGPTVIRLTYNKKTTQ